MSNLLLVPIQIDALCLDKDQLAVEAKADFSVLPYQKEGVDQNSESVNLSDSILSHEFQNLNFTLKKGIHLHWALPDGLTMGAQDANNRVVYPQIPNRWLVCKYSNGQLESQWIVESDYLHPQGMGNDYESVSYPIDLNNYTAQVIPSDPNEEAYQPFRFIGRQLLLDDWDETESVDRLKYLSVAGYGEPSFAAFYPNCYSILGFHEESATDLESLKQTEYSVIGWYADSSSDPLNELILANSEFTVEEIASLIQQEFNWKIPKDLTNAPNNIVCFGNISFNPSSNNFENSQTSDVEIAIGNSGKEALAAYMSQKFHPENKKIAEEQLMAIQLSSMVNTGSTDVGPSFNKAFHDDQFTSINGQTVWLVSLQSNSTNTLDTASQSNKDENIQLPPDLIHQINDLNLVQEKYEKALDQIAFLRHALFSDWYKYMVSAYPSSDELNSYPDMNLIRYFIENESIPELEDLIKETGVVTYTQDTTTNYVTTVQANELNTIAAQVAAFFAQLKSLVDLYNSGTPSATYYTALCNKGTLPEGVSADANISWVNNSPMSDQCIQFSGTNYLSYNIENNCRAISFWVKVNAQQSSDAIFFNIENVSNSTIGVSGFGSFWSNVFVDGIKVNPEINKDWSTIPKDKWVHFYIESASPFNGDLFLFSSDGNQNFANGQLASFRLFERTISVSDIYTDRNIFLKNQALIQQQTGGKYYQGNEPIILFSGNDVTISLRHGFDGRLDEEDLLSCNSLEDITLPISKSAIDNLSLLTYIQDNKPKKGEELIGYQFWNNAPWNPFMFEWETELFPLLKENGFSTTGGNYQNSFIEDNFQQQMNQEALIPDSNASVSGNALVYTGYTIITNQAQLNLQAQVIIFLNNQLSADYAAQFGASLDTQENQDSFNNWYALKPTVSDTNFTTYTDWIATFPFEIPSNLTNNIISQAIGAYTEVTQLNVQSQSLGGFNKALLMFSQALQLPISDPLGFQDAKDFTKKVADLVTSKNTSVAHPLNTFMPIRSGSLSINRLRLVDTFGQYKDVNNLDALIVPESMNLPNGYQNGQLYLPPTFSQPSRLDFRWLSADNGEQEVNSAQNSNPICGWILPNFMDLSIMVYDQNGYSLGYIDINAVWQPTPGDSTPLDPKYISNPYLKKVVQQLCILSGETDATKAQYVNDFINMMAQALVNISPVNFAQQQGSAILMGRPLAVVRCSLNLEVKGKLAYNQSWNTFRADLNKEERTTNGFENIQFPLRIGDRSQLNDGLVGYWKENSDTTLSTSFYTTIAEGVVNNSEIISFESDPIHLQQAISSPTQLLTMLIDPNGTAHAHSGILPTKCISIPSNKFAQALQNINITFLSSPIITAKDFVELSLPNEPGYNWSWVAKQGLIWKQVGAVGTVTINDFTSKFTNGLEIWNTLVSNNWITTQDNANAQIVAEDQRTTSDLGGAFSAQLIEIQNILNQAQINPFDYEGNFKSSVEAIEGWLKLSPQ